MSDTPIPAPGDNGAPAPSDKVAPAPSSRLQAHFWQSPFAVSSALVVSAQMAILIYAAATGQAAPYKALTALTFLALVMLVAGVWPAWNYLAVGENGVEQQAGLTSLKVRWADVTNIDMFEQGLVLSTRAPGDADTGEPIKVRLFNRYGMGPEDFADKIERAWRHGADHPLAW